MSKGHEISPSKEKPTTKKAHRGGDCPAASTPLLQGTAMYQCPQGHSALSLSNTNTKHKISLGGKNISELTLWHLCTFFIFFFFFSLNGNEGQELSNMTYAEPAVRTVREAGSHTPELSPQPAVRTSSSASKGAECCTLGQWGLGMNQS